MSTDRQTLNDGVSPLERVINSARDLPLKVELRYQETCRAEVNYWITEIEDAVENGHPDREKRAREYLVAAIDRWT